VFLFVVFLIPLYILVCLMYSGRRSGWGGSRGSAERWGKDPSRLVHAVSARVFAFGCCLLNNSSFFSNGVVCNVSEDFYNPSIRDL
jgi:hypothetical protein